MFALIGRFWPVVKVGATSVQYFSCQVKVLRF